MIEHDMVVVTHGCMGKHTHICKTCLHTLNRIHTTSALK